MLTHNKDDIQFVTEFPCFLGHPVHQLFQVFMAGIVHTLHEYLEGYMYDTLQYDIIISYRVSHEI